MRTETRRLVPNRPGHHEVKRTGMGQLLLKVNKPCMRYLIYQQVAIALETRQIGVIPRLRA